MIDPAELERRLEALDVALESWRQGDFVIGPFGFVVRFDPEFPLNPGEQDDGPDSDLYEDAVEGLVVLTQTCDIVRKSKDRPFVEVCPLVAIKDPSALENIRKGKIPRYAFLQGAAALMLVADLDRVMTIEKSLLGTWPRKPGCTSDQALRDFADALARKRARFAFPDDFVLLVEDFRVRITRKHDKQSHEGKCLRLLREIRVTASPSWGSEDVSLKFWFIVVEETSPTDPGLTQQCMDWMALISLHSRFTSIDHDIVSMDDISAREYICSDRLDLDHLSRS